MARLGSFNFQNLSQREVLMILPNTSNVNVGAMAGSGYYTMTGDYYIRPTQPVVNYYHFNITSKGALTINPGSAVPDGAEFKAIFMLR